MNTEMNPCLIRTAVDDALFADFMKEIDMIIIRKYNYHLTESESEDDMHGILLKGLKIYAKDLTYTANSWAFLWLRYVCITNNQLYKSIITCFFNEKNLLKSKRERKQYIEDRFIKMKVLDYQIDDFYYIIKGYMDTVFATGDKVIEILRETQSFFPKRKFIKKVNAKLDKTENIKRIYNSNEIAELMVRDFYTNKNIGKI